MNISVLRKGENLPRGVATRVRTRKAIDDSGEYNLYHRGEMHMPTQSQRKHGTKRSLALRIPRPC